MAAASVHEWVRAWRAVLDAPDVQHRRLEVDLLPAQIDHLGRPQAVPVGQKHHEGITVAVAVVAHCPISFSTSPSVKCSRVRSSAFFGRRSRWLAAPAGTPQRLAGAFLRWRAARGF